MPLWEKMSNEKLIETQTGNSEFITQIELAKRIPVSRRTLFNWRASGKIPAVCLGGRKLLFHWPSVEAALLRQQRGGVA
jgi:predicted site-specific integrase-resolvase